MLAKSAWFHFVLANDLTSLKDKRDDVKAGVKSTAILFGSKTKLILASFAVLFVAALAAIGVQNHQGPAFYLVSVVGSGMHFAWQLTTLDTENPKDCLDKFLVRRRISFLTDFTIPP
jgi:4-hydroxybenzoate polyprenyltransferase